MFTQALKFSNKFYFMNEITKRLEIEKILTDALKRINVKVSNTAAELDIQYIIEQINCRISQVH